MRSFLPLVAAFAAGFVVCHLLRPGSCVVHIDHDVIEVERPVGPEEWRRGTTRLKIYRSHTDDTAEAIDYDVPDDGAEIWKISVPDASGGKTCYLATVKR